MDKKKIFIVDDEPNIVSMLEDILAEEYDVTHAYDGQTALSEIPKANPNLIMMDMMMPGLSGYEVLRILQQHPETKSIPILLMTARDFDRSTQHYLKHESNVVEYINKPLRPSELVIRLRELVK